ncbi:quinone-dependent dihydroorotate dehydrogenase [Gorillibacterium sp. sgz500922]|uniref:quinone-dependent dihydroorotate dehydrogenase n=1 Tax=Gorillibacterium sp. sgz500922 TaxID=3446694 RepID=UPI003F66B78F
MLYRWAAKPLLFRMDPEKAHHLTIAGLSAAAAVPGMLPLMHALYGVQERPELRVELWGCEFPNPVGLAAGLDKNAVAVPGLAAIGFGFLEVGTVTPRPQPGNAKPRLYRLPEDGALINRMGFNNDGAAAMKHELGRLKRRPVPVCVNIGKNKDTPSERAAEDYRACIRELYDEADWFAVNISSPNTPGLRSLQHGDELRLLLAAVRDQIGQEANRRGMPEKAVVLKIAPDLTDGELEQLAETALQSGISGMIAANTTLDRGGLTHANAGEAGGLSGRPLAKRSLEVLRRLYRTTGGRIPLIGSGGIFDADDAYERIRAGASLVEIYTAMIYEGPELLRRLNDGLAARLRADGFARIGEAVGSGNR